MAEQKRKEIAELEFLLTLIQYAYKSGEFNDRRTNSILGKLRTEISDSKLELGNMS